MQTTKNKLEEINSIKYKVGEINTEKESIIENSGTTEDSVTIRKKSLSEANETFFKPDDITIKLNSHDGKPAIKFSEIQIDKENSKTLVYISEIEDEESNVNNFELCDVIKSIDDQPEKNSNIVRQKIENFFTTAKDGDSMNLKINKYEINEALVKQALSKIDIKDTGVHTHNLDDINIKRLKISDVSSSLNITYTDDNGLVYVTSSSYKGKNYVNPFMKNPHDKIDIDDIIIGIQNSYDNSNIFYLHTEDQLKTFLDIIKNNGDAEPYYLWLRTNQDIIQKQVWHYPKPF